MTAPSISPEIGLNRRVRTFVTAIVLAWLTFTAFDSSAWSGQTVEPDRDALKEAVKAYFKAEISGNLKKVWEMLAPSSEFKRAYSYEFYEEMQRREGIRVRAYNIDEVLRIADNPDRKKMPDVDKVAIVRVNVRLVGRDGKETRHSVVLTFLREAGRWYKG